MATEVGKVEVASIWEVAKRIVERQSHDEECAPTELAAETPQSEVGSGDEEGVKASEVAKIATAYGKRAGLLGMRAHSFQDYELVQAGPVNADLYDACCAKCWALDREEATEMVPLSSGGDSSEASD